jgi:type I restriction enzyme S subunit
MWEAMLYRHFRKAGYTLRGCANRSGQHGPDFGVETDRGVIWVEATVPAPIGIPVDYLEQPRIGEIRVKTKPDQERVLRCASVIADKQKKFDEYRQKGIIGPHDPAVIALNICRLSEWDVEGTGISQYPLAMEALFPIGPIAAPISPDGTMGAAQNTPRGSLKKANGVDMPAAFFLEPQFAGVSAVIQAHQRDMFEKELILSTVHNPLATNSLTIGLFGPYKEFVAQQQGDGFQIHDVRLEARVQQLIESLTARFHRREDVVVRAITTAEAGDFAGVRSKCHENVNRWCFAHYEHSPVRGWLISGDSVLDKHSLIKIGDELVEITPTPDNARLTFLPHDGTEDEFIRLSNQIILARGPG